LQVIFASDIDSTISTFGWSLSAGMDLDENEYPGVNVINLFSFVADDEAK
jgi:hypothetical protein